MGVTSRHIGVTVTETAQGVTRHIPIRGCDGCDGLPELGRSASQPWPNRI